MADLFAYFSETSSWHISFVSFPNMPAPKSYTKTKTKIMIPVNTSVLGEKLF